MRKELWGIIFGFGLEAVLFLLDLTVMGLPEYLVTTGYIAGGLLMLGGLVGLAWPRKNTQPPEPLVSQTGDGIQSVGQSGGITAHTVNVAGGEALETGVEQPRVLWEPTDDPHEGTPYISANVALEQSSPSRTIDCYVVLKSLSFNGVPRRDLADRATKHTSRISWSGGDDRSGGIKIIDAGTSATLNIANLSMRGLSFLMAKGPVGNFKKGTYELSLELRGRSNGKQIVEISQIVAFEYYDDPGAQATYSHGPITVIGRPRNENLRLIRGGR